MNNDSNHYKFTGKERDSETGLTHELNTNDNLGNLFLYGSHGDGLFKDTMDLGTLYDPHTTILEPQKAGLLDQFNRDNELDNGITIDTTKATPPK